MRGAGGAECVMKNSFSLPIRKFLLFSLGMCVVLAAGFLAARGSPRSLCTLIVAGISFVAGISCVLIVGLLLLLSAQKAVREALGCIPQTDMASNQGNRAESPKVKEVQPRLDPVEFNLLACVAETLQTMRPQARKKGLEIACEVQSDVPELVVGDGSRLRQVLINMVGNTIKFTERGEVMVRVERQSHGRGDCVLHFTV
jgi:signal transduction histidine kinase